MWFGLLRNKLYPLFVDVIYSSVAHNHWFNFQSSVFIAILVDFARILENINMWGVYGGHLEMINEKAKIV